MTVLNYSRGRYAQSYTPTLKHADPKKKKGGYGDDCANTFLRYDKGREREQEKEGRSRRRSDF